MGNDVGIRPETDLQGFLQDLVVASAGLDDFLEGFVEATSAAPGFEPHDTTTSVALLRPRAHPLLVGSTRDARRLARLEVHLHDGPSVRAAASGRTVGVPDFSFAGEDPLFGSAALRHGVRSALSTPIAVQGPERAVITYYSSRPSSFTDEHRCAAERFAAAGATSVGLALRLARLRDRADHLAAAMESRTTIDLAAGVMMAQNRCSQEEAIEILRAASSARNMKLRELARNVLTSTVDAPVSTHFD